MVKTAFSILAVTAAAGIALTPVAASAATAGPAVLAYSSSPSASDPTTSVTFTVTVGALSLTAPATANLGSGAPGGTISGDLGNGAAGDSVVVTDDRALLAASWVATASASSWTTGGATPLETIPVADVGYAVGSITTTGTITATGTNLPAGTATGDLSGAAKTVVTGSAGSGNNTAGWDPTISVAVPASAVGGVYTGTLTQSVS